MKNPSPAPEEIIALSLVEGAGRKTLRAALRFSARNGMPLSACFGLPIPKLLACAAPDESAAVDALSRCTEQDQFRADWMMGAAQERGLRHITPNMPEYPSFVSEALGDQAPVVIFYLGNEALLQTPGAGIVGTQRPTREGAALATQAAQAFAGEGIPVVSGGARGIDQVAHHAALNADGTTVAILPEGLYAYEPPSFLRAGLERGQVLLLSEFLPTDGWLTHRAMTRNKTIAACSTLVCVLEPRKNGGSMFTAEQALAQGKPVFCWGGACRDGALHGQKNTYALAEPRGQAHTRALLHAARQPQVKPSEQINLFD